MSVHAHFIQGGKEVDCGKLSDIFDKVPRVGMGMEIRGTKYPILSIVGFNGDIYLAVDTTPTQPTAPQAV